MRKACVAAASLVYTVGGVEQRAGSQENEVPSKTPEEGFKGSFIIDEC